MAAPAAAAQTRIELALSSASLNELIERARVRADPPGTEQRAPLIELELAASSRAHHFDYRDRFRELHALIVSATADRLC